MQYFGLCNMGQLSLGLASDVAQTSFGGFSGQLFWCRLLEFCCFLFSRHEIWCIFSENVSFPGAGNAVGLGGLLISRHMFIVQEATYIITVLCLQNTSFKYCFLREKQYFLRRKINRGNHKVKMERKASCKKIKRQKNKLGNGHVINLAKEQLLLYKNIYTQFNNHQCSDFKNVQKMIWSV